MLPHVAFSRLCLFKTLDSKIIDYQLLLSYFETGSYYTAQVGLEINPLASGSQEAGITGTYH